MQVFVFSGASKFCAFKLINYVIIYDLVWSEAIFFHKSLVQWDLKGS